MGLLALYWGAMIIAYIIASKNRNHADKLAFIEKAVMPVVYIMVLIMGLRMGVNEQVTSNLGSIGLKAFGITIFAVGGSIGAVMLVRRIMKMDMYGDLICKDAQNHASEGTSEEKPSISKDDIKSTLVILALVIAGMGAGYIIANRLPQILSSFDVVTEYSLVVFLCILLFLVGFDLGITGKVVANIKTVGVRALAFPFAAVIGSLLIGTVAGMLCGFSLREGLAISAGFGWYTYAPTVIASAGSQYMVASAVSFMHNVIREVGGIVLIPILAKKIGYIEVASIPGVAAMDVCMPIVERSCRHDTVVYSLAIGFLMCIVTSVIVPLVMGV